jgi:hypothetical protein
MGKQSRLKKLRRLQKTASITQTLSDIEVADDYREQQQRRFSKIDPNILTQKFIRRWPECLQHLHKTFPHTAELDITLDIALGHLSKTKLVTKYDEPLTHQEVTYFSDLVNSAVLRIGLPMYGGISVGAIHSEGIEAMQQKVMLTEASVVMINANLSLAMYRLAKLLALTTPITIFPHEKYKISESLEEYKEKYANDQTLKQNWMQFFYDYAYDRKNPGKGSAISLPTVQCASFLEDLYESLFVFVIAHEYSHHIAKHTLEYASASGECIDIAHQKELEADMLGTHICMEVGGHSEVDNISCFTTIGIPTLFSVLEMFRIGEKILLTGKIDESPTRSTHPSPSIRIRAIRQVISELYPEGIDTITRMQDMFHNLICYIWEDAKITLLSAHSKGVRPLINKNTDWLP